MIACFHHLLFTPFAEWRVVDSLILLSVVVAPLWCLELIVTALRKWGRRGKGG